MYLIYCYTNKKNDKKYIGLTSRSIEEREASHISESKNKTNKCYNTPFKRAIRKYGIEGFKRDIICTADTLEEACKLEKYYIKKYKTYYKYKNSNGYNATIGGELIQCPKDRVIQISTETLEIICVWDSVAIAEKELEISIYDAVNNYSTTANNSYWIYERNFNIETYKHDIMITKNYICQISRERKLIKIWKGPKEASIKLGISQGNISMCCIGLRETTNDNYWCYYKDYIIDNYPIKKLGNNKKSVIQFSKNGEIIKVWESLTDAADMLKISVGEISRACKNHKLAGTFLWGLYDYYNGEEINYINNNKTRVEKIDENNTVICSYESITEAANDVGVKYTGICRAIKNKCRSAGFYWRKVGDTNELSQYNNR